jgi:multidrug efflux pump subunit AcrA (membrane-fusion protein)
MPTKTGTTKSNFKKTSLKNKRNFSQLLQIVIVSLFLILAINFLAKPKSSIETQNIDVKSVDSQILADGKIASQNEAKINFQTPGKLVYLPFKEGDVVTKGQTIASLDVYTLQRQLETALNNYRTTRNTFDQTSDNTSTGVLQGQQKYNLEVPNKSGIGSQGEINIINDMVKRIVDQNQAGLDNSVVQVELANYALQLSALQSPINGIVIHEDVTVANINITPATSFTIADPAAVVFRAQVKEQDIDYISTGSEAIIHVNGKDSQTISGTVIQIHPEKQALSNGQNIYNVDVTASDLKNGFSFGQTGFIQIKSNVNTSTLLVPAWTVLDNQYIWVKENDKTLLKKITVGKSRGSNIEVLSGLTEQDKVIINPESNISKSYRVL